MRRQLVGDAIGRLASPESSVPILKKNVNMKEGYNLSCLFYWYLLNDLFFSKILT